MSRNGYGGCTVAIFHGELRSEKDLVFFLRFFILFHFGKDLGLVV